ncbi:MAG: DNA-binding response regulator [Hydrogenophilaceae bacterium CG1_02_62_390]|nr:MAG: DNA-binding response regulator [Hydrogenophilaceae bacterium CG1_02_62_390]PIW37469.1 MAG: DNA-binding response regulator [Hydrogenophilales bacterium CG15_BIG_FIL_POST_REV_8_21_14_020_62_31]PIW71522.1 MAG: DNA-binding response regulator [Hydrogenophilales bacterium CG12_big_fil_rev_8_21_14_0_65_61_21]PIX01237.1 MAG: DNA-binding response regulator [Hydrogenophilales bacterium CG_4_8_14_3_um_filter_62_83]
MRILLVEDDDLLGDGLQAGLRHAGYNAEWLRDGVQARSALATEQYAAVVLDLGLPRLDGISVLREMRAAGNATPVLVLTARDSTLDKIKGLDSGADDYLIKPVDLDELSARLRALIRRSSGQAAPLLRVGDLELDPAARRAWLAGQALDLPAKELAVLEMLMRNAGRIVSRGQLESALYGWDEGVESNAVEVHIHHLRRKLGAETIRTQRGLGYLLEKN